ncbi:SDH family Clp fold serine proteinase [Methanosarcina sp. Mfa9]|uniref:SDH family Clp fold serine proteinase n=1 Tax=Methanosarcina sp. Mfa9 TaxID=3439063 RepID=UPI003F8712F7
MLTLLFLFFFLYAVIYPQWQLKVIRMQRQARLKRMEKRWSSKVLTMIHRREAISMFGLPAYQFIDEEDAEQVLRWIRNYRKYPLDLILHTPGGQLHASIQIARALKKHPKKTRVIIPHYSMSGGTMIALAADEIVMDKDAVIGPIDPQIGDFVRGLYPAPSWIYAAETKKEKADDSTLVMSDISRKSLELTRKVAKELLADKPKKANNAGKADKAGKTGNPGIADDPGTANSPGTADNQGTADNPGTADNQGTADNPGMSGKAGSEQGREIWVDEVVEKLVSGEMIHITPLSAEEAKQLGLNVNTDFPPEVHEFMRFFRPAKMNVEYVE